MFPHQNYVGTGLSHPNTRVHKSWVQGHPGDYISYGGA